MVCLLMSPTRSTRSLFTRTARATNWMQPVRQHLTFFSSFIQTIIETSKLYGVDVTEEDIIRVKAAGDANNDWKVSLDSACLKVGRPA